MYDNVQILFWPTHIQQNICLIDFNLEANKIIGIKGNATYEIRKSSLSI